MAKIARVIKYEGDNSTIIWKCPYEDFNSLTQLVVHESQEAIFMMNGEALDLFSAGHYTLDTQNIPKLEKNLRKLTKGSPFHCEVYFINKAELMAIKWGTDSKVQYIEPTYGFPLSIGASGEMSLQVKNSRKLLLKMVGTEKVLTQQKLIQHLKLFMMGRIKTYIAQTMRLNTINIFEIDENLSVFSDAIKSLLSKDFEDYGISLEQFFVTNIAKPDGDYQYEKFKELHFRQYADIAEAKIQQQVSVIRAQTEAQKTVIASQAIATKRAQEGYTYQQERAFDVSEKVAQNEAIGQFANLGIGIGTMVGVGGAVGGIIGGIMNDTFSSSETAFKSIICPKCNMNLPPNAKFCFGCGEKIEQISSDETICPMCGKITLKGKFCIECGASLIHKCPKCGVEFPSVGKFCLECGEKLDNKN